MFQSIIVTLSLLGVITTGQPEVIEYKDRLLSSHSIEVEQYGVYGDNMLLTMSYLRGAVKNANFTWEEIRKPFTYEMKLNPGEVFAYHDDILPQYKKRLKMTTNAHFSYAQGFKSDGRLVGMGVCNLASLINWVARDAGLEVVSPTNHGFAKIYGIPWEFGVSIYTDPTVSGANAHQNLYITNNLKNVIMFHFEYDGSLLKVSILERLTI